MEQLTMVLLASMPSSSSPPTITNPRRKQPEGWRVAFGGFGGGGYGGGGGGGCGGGGGTIQGGTIQEDSCGPTPAIQVTNTAYVNKSCTDLKSSVEGTA